jgi:hypothetical protein
MSKRDCELKTNRKHVTTIIWKEGLSQKAANGRLPQAVTQNQLDYINFLMQKLDEAGIAYPKPNLESLTKPFDRFTINPNKRFQMKRKIGYLQNIAKNNGVDLSEWESRKPKKEIYKPYSAQPLTLKKLSARKG